MDTAAPNSTDQDNPFRPQDDHCLNPLGGTRKVAGSKPPAENIFTKFPDFSRSLPDLESAQDMANDGRDEPQFAGDRRRITEPVLASDRSETCNEESNHVENGESVDAEQRSGFGSRKFKDRCRIDTDITGSNPTNHTDRNCQKHSKNLKHGCIRQSDMMLRLLQIVKNSRPKNCKTDKHLTEEIPGEQVSLCENKGRKRRRRKIECDSESLCFTGSGLGEQMDLQKQRINVQAHRQKQRIGSEASDFGKDKPPKVSDAVCQNSSHSGLQVVKQERIAHTQVQTEITTEGKKLRRRKNTSKPGIANPCTGDNTQNEMKRRKVRKGKAQCVESVGSLDGEDIHTEPQHLQRKKQRRLSKKTDANEITNNVTGAAMDNGSSTSKFTELVDKEQLVTSNAANLSGGEKPLVKGRGRPKRQSAKNMESRALPHAEEPKGRKATTKKKEDGALQKHKQEKVEEREATSNEPKINAFYPSFKEKETSTPMVDTVALGEDAALMKVPRLIDGFEGQNHVNLPQDTINVPMVEGMVTDRSSPTVGEDVSSVLTEAEGNKDSKDFATEPEKPRKAWVLCDDCKKWRHIPVELADQIEATNCRWSCRDNTNKEFADCSIPQEKSNAEINAELDISEISNCDENDNADGQVDSKAFNRQHIEVSQQNAWTLITRSIFNNRRQKSQTVDEIMVCQCKAPEDGSPGCGDECLNRMLSIECVPGTCPCGELCSNQRFQKRSYAKVGWFRCGKKGFGLQLLEDVPRGTFIIEYVGEVLELQEHEARQKEYASRGQKHFYFMTLNSNEVIDACVKGNLARYINHSCDPNCQTEKWMVNGEVCVGFFAIRDLVKGEEVTFDYNFVRFFGAAAKKCECGSVDCRGFIGGDPITPTVVVENESDGEDPEPIILTEESEDVGTVVDSVKSPQIEKIQNSPEAKTQDRIQSNSVVKKLSSGLGSSDKKGTAKKLKRSKTVSTSEKSIALNAKELTISTRGRFEGVEEKLNEMLDGSSGIAKRRDAAKHYLKLLVVTAASGDANGEGSGSTRDLSMVLDALLKTESRSVLLDIADKNGLQLLHNMIKQHRKNYNKTPIIRKLLKVLQYFATKQVITPEQINSIPSREGVESFKKSIFELTEHSDMEVQKIARHFKKWVILPTGKSREGKQSQSSLSVVKANNQTWKREKLPSSSEPSSMNSFKVPGRHAEGTPPDCGQVMAETGDTHDTNGKLRGRLSEPADDWNSPNEQNHMRKGKRESDMDDSRQFLPSEKQCSDSLAKDFLPGDCSNIRELRSSGSFPLTNNSDERQWCQGSRKNFHNKNGRWHSGFPPRYSSRRSAPWQDTLPHDRGANPATDVRVSDRKIEPHHVAQPNTVTSGNANLPVIVRPAVPSLGGGPFPHGSGIADGSTQGMFSPQLPVAYGVPVALFQQLYGIPICRSAESSVTGGQHPREIMPAGSATPCRIPCEHFSMPQTINTLQPFHNSGSQASTAGFPHGLSVCNSHSLTSGFTGSVGVPSSLHLGVRPPQFHHNYQVPPNQTHRQGFSCEHEKNERTVSTEGNGLEPEPPVPGLSPPRLLQASNSLRYQPTLDLTHERNRTSSFFGSNRDLLCRKDSPEITRGRSNLLSNPNVQDTANQIILNNDSEEQATKACTLDACSNRMSNYVSQHVSTGCDSKKSSPLYMERVCHNADEMYSPETVASSSSNHVRFSGPCHLRGARQHDLCSSKHETKIEENGADDALSLTHNGEHSEARKFPKEEQLGGSSKAVIDCCFNQGEGMNRSFNAVDGSSKIQSEYCDSEVFRHVEHGRFDQHIGDTIIEKNLSLAAEKSALPIDGNQPSAVGKLS